MKKYEEDRYIQEHIREHIYPWIKEKLVDHEVLGGRIISEKDTPLVSFVGDLMVVFVIKRENETFEILKENMLPPGCDIEKLYYKACENLAKNVHFVISQTLYGGFGIVADGHHEASSLCLKHIWNLCAEKLEDDLVIMAPAKDMVLFMPAKDLDGIEKMRIFGMESYKRNQDKISEKLMFFDREKKELRMYEQKD
ncbi:hypothetical protein [Lachnoclostridium sp. An181]|uniref:hypothetical protein n=1 Tax=Lachnoclostridium sp. An181 TaxID=1965575 RepID=UPI000B369F60|nr:hypothetical protein [Lachnoclostridium sp. An181]OUP48757.1 hypothetical protein B5F18_11015 [Lachnoclostridium sp. An181]